MHIPGYRIEREVGFGGMATVYLAVHERLNRRVALKVMSPALAADRTFSERFIREGKTVAQLSHLNIIQVHDIGVVNHHHYIVMEYVDCGDLKQRTKQNPLLPDEALRIICEVAGALGHAHGKGFVHRDVKPENILFRSDGSSVLTDFGIAKAVNAGTKMTGTGMSIGTPHYMSPEQARGKVLDGRADIYALGVVLYEMLTGQVPYDSEDSFAIGIMHINDPIPVLPSGLSNYQPLIDYLMAKDPGNRFSSTDEMVAFIHEIASGAKLKRPKHATQLMASVALPEKKPASVMSWLLGGGFVAVVLFGAAFLYMNQNQRKIIGGGGAGMQALHDSSELKDRVSRLQSTLQEQKKSKSELENLLLSEKQRASSLSHDANKTRDEVARLRRELQHKNQSKSASNLSQSAMNDQISTLLHEANQYMQSMKYTRPSGANAVEKFKAALRLDGNNTEALQGIDNIASYYYNKAQDRNKAGQADASLAATRQGLLVKPEHKGLQKLQQQLIASLNDRVKRLSSELSTAKSHSSNTGASEKERLLQEQRARRRLESELASLQGKLADEKSFQQRLLEDEKRKRVALEEEVQRLREQMAEKSNSGKRRLFGAF